MRPSIFLQLPSEDFLVGFGPISFSAFPSASAPCFFMSDFLLERSLPWVVVNRTEILSRSKLFEHLVTEKDRNEEIVWDLPQTDIFVSKFRKIQDLIASEKILKAVPVISENGTIPNEWNQEVFEILAGRMLRSVTRGLICFGVNLGSSGIVGATPELIFQREDNEIRTIALAGTQKDKDLLNNSKDSKEQEIVVKDLLHQISSLGAVAKSAPESIDYGSVSHIRTEISCRFEGSFDFQTVLSKLHPSAAIGIYPRSTETSAILGTLRQKGDLFAAPMGAILDDRSSFAISMIRSIQWVDLKAVITSGCGVIAESSLEGELAELALKRNSVKTRVQGTQSNVQPAHYKTNL